LPELKKGVSRALITGPLKNLSYFGDGRVFHGGAEIAFKQKSGRSQKQQLLKEVNEINNWSFQYWRIKYI